MKHAELRVMSTLALAIATIVAATYWLVLRHDSWTLWNLTRGTFIVLGAAGCVALTLVALRQNWNVYHQQVIAHVRSCIAADDPMDVPLPADPFAGHLVANVRDHTQQFQDKIQQLQVQRKKLEIELRLADNERRQSQTMINGIADAVLVTNNFDELLTANPAAAELFSFELAQVQRKSIAGIIDVPKLAADISDIRQNHSRANRRTMDLSLDRGNATRTFTVTMASVNDSSDQFCGVVTVLHDTTREREVSRMKSEFVSHVSHELRTPLSSIKAYAELLVDGEANDEKTRSEFYHIIQSEADRLSRLIDNILNISRIEAGMTRVNKKPISLTAVLKEVLEVAAPSAHEKNINLIDAVAPVFFQIEADRDMVYQAALNLISNAIKYTPANGTVKVTTSVDEAENQVTVLVIDSGVGIPPEAMKHLFEKFYRVEQHKTLAKGSGLGLNLTRQIIETVHKGKMIVRSEVGKGSTFGFALPIIP